MSLPLLVSLMHPIQLFLQCRLNPWVFSVFFFNGFKHTRIKNKQNITAAHFRGEKEQMKVRRSILKEKVSFVSGVQSLQLTAVHCGLH